MDNTSYQRLRDIVSGASTVSIAVGKNPSIDAMASALSLYLIFKNAEKNPSIAAATQPLVEHSNLVGIDKVTPQFEGGNGDLTVSFPYREGEIEKVSYTIENNFLNIVVKAGRNGLTFDENQVRFTRGGSAPSVLFIVGTPRLSDLGDLFNPESLKDTKIVNIDNKKDNQGFGDVVLVSPNASSVSEVVSEIIFSLNMPLDQDSAQNLLSGLMDATGNLMNPNTSPRAFEMVAYLMKNGARRSPQKPEPQNEERVSSFMPEQSLSSLGGNTNIPTPQPRPQMPQRSSRPQPQTRASSQNGNQGGQKPPSDWLTPKVYKGSSNV